jgi:hypothetical protein
MPLEKDVKPVCERVNEEGVLKGRAGVTGALCGRVSPRVAIDIFREVSW